MAQFTNWNNTKLIVEAHHTDLLHTAQKHEWQDKEPRRSLLTFTIRSIGFLLVLFLLFTAVGRTDAQSNFDAEPHLQRLTTALEAGNYLDAYGEFFQINDSAPAVVKAMFETQAETDSDKQVQAFFLVFTGHAEAALEVVDTLPASAFTYAVTAIANDLLGNTDDASDSLAQAVELAVDDATVYGLIANAAFINFNVESMMSNSTRALELAPELPLALRAHGLASLISGDLEAALADADQGLELDPTFYGFYTLRANIHLALGDLDAALGDLDAALALNPDSYIANAIRSGVNMALGNVEVAGRDFMAAVNIKTVEIVEGETLTADEALPLTMTLGRTFRLSIEAGAGQSLTIQVTSTTPGEVDSTVMLLSPEGVPLVFNDDANDETLDAQIDHYPITKSGTYIVVISHANGGSEGEIAVALTESQL